MYEANACRSAENIYDEWVQKSFVALSKLLPVRYSKVEQGSRTLTRFINKPSSLHGAALLLALLAGCAAPAPKPVTPPVETVVNAPAAETDVPAAAPVEPAPPSAAELQFQQAIAALNDRQEQQAETLFKALADDHPQLASPAPISVSCIFAAASRRKPNSFSNRRSRSTAKTTSRTTTSASFIASKANSTTPAPNTRRPSPPVPITPTRI